MNGKQWEIVKNAVKCNELEAIPCGMIVDSPWIPGYCNINTLDFYTNPGIWMDCYRKIKKDFPEMILFPDYWVEFGMASESGSFGCRSQFYSNQPVAIRHIIESADELEDLQLDDPNPEIDGYMPLALNYYRNLSNHLKGTDEKITMVASRGPLNILSFIMSVPELCVAVKTDPESLHRALKKTTALVIRWLKAQMDAVGDTVEGILVLDDICGFLNEEDYLEFAHPYLKQIFDSFNVPVKMFHNDNFGNNYTTFPYINDLGINLFNFSHKADILEARKRLGDKVCIFGNIPPLDVLTKGTPSDVAAATKELLKKYSSTSGLILSAGGGASPGMPYDNCRAMLDALCEYNAALK